MNNIFTYLIGWKAIAVAVILSSILASWSGYKLRDITADRDLARAEQTLAEYKLTVASDTAQANQKTLSELNRLGVMLNELEDKLVQERQLRNQESSILRERLRNAQNTPFDDSISPVLREYLNGLRNLQTNRRTPSTD